jgi:hypothetical protein
LAKTKGIKEVLADTHFRYNGHRKVKVEVYPGVYETK